MHSYSRDRGISAVWLAMVFLFLIGAAALAVDASGGFNVAQTDQNTADLACLAGVRDLPGDATAAIGTTVDYVEENWPSMASQNLVVSGTQADYTDGNGNAVHIDVAYQGDTSKEYVQVTEVQQTWFARVIGADSVIVTQEAWCRVSASGSGGGSLPFGATPGGFDGNLQDFNPCPTGNCGPIDIPRTTPNGGGPQFVENLAVGGDRDLAAFWGPIDSTAKVCNTVGAGGVCHILDTNNGVSAGQLGEGMSRRLENYVGASNPDLNFTSKGVYMNGDTRAGVLTGDNSGSLALLTDVYPLGSCPGDCPAWWEPNLYGPWDASNTADHYYYDAPLAFCDHPRIGFIPIITDDMNWHPSTGGPATFNGNTIVKVVGFYWVIIVDPNESGDFFGNNNLKNGSSVVVWFGPDANTCGPSGTPFDPSMPGLTVKQVSLVDGTN